MTRWCSYNLRIPITVGLSKTRIGAQLELETRNVSQGGIFLATTTPLELNRIVRLEVTLPVGERLCLFAKITHVVRPSHSRQQPGFGVELCGNRSGELERWEAFVSGFGSPIRVAAL